MNRFTAKRDTKGVPMWTLFDAHGHDIGMMTDLPMEASPMATVRYCGEATTVARRTIPLTLAAARAAYEEAEAAHTAALDAEDHIEDEDGEIARMRLAENAADMWAMQHEHEEPNW